MVFWIHFDQSNELSVSFALRTTKGCTFGIRFFFHRMVNHRFQARRLWLRHSNFHSES